MANNSKYYKGTSFETLVGVALTELCDKHNWLVLSDIRLGSSSERGYTQIDFLVFTPVRYFCIETKDWNCTVHCSTNRYWETDYGRIVKTLNPVIQNKNHITKMNKRILPSRIEGIVCFSNDTILKDKPEGVMNFSDMLMYLDNIANQRRIISQEEIGNDFRAIASESLDLKIKDIDISKI